MKYLLGIALIVASFAVAQEHGATPEPASAGQDHAQAVANHGEGHEEAPMPNEIWWKWANFAVLAGGLGYLIGKNAGPFFRARTEEIQRGISDAAKVKADAEARAAEIESKVGNLAAEVERLRATSKQEITSEGARVQAETQAQIAKVQSQAQVEIQSATKHASAQLKAYSAQLALEFAEKQLRQKLDQGTQEELANAFVADIRKTAPQGQQAGGVQ